MDEKRFSELFPEVEKDQGEEKQREFFAHMKRQLKPEKEWKLPGAAELAKRKKKRWKLTAYSATAAACLLLAILLPNLPVLLKISEQDTSISGKKESSIAGFSEWEQDTSVVTEDTSGERQRRMPEDELGAEESAERQDGNNGNEKEENGEKKNGTGEDAGEEPEPEDAGAIEQAKQEKNEKTGNEEKTEKEKSAASGADNGVGSVTDKGSSNGDGNTGSTEEKKEEKKPQKVSGSGKGTEGKQNMAVTADHQEKETADSSGEEIIAESACEEEEPAADEAVQNGTGAETAADTEDTAADMPVDTVMPDFAEIEEAAEETVVTEEAAETENSTETAKDDAEEMVSADLALETALTAWRQTEYGAADTGNTTDLEMEEEMEETSVAEQSMTKEEVQQKLLCYPYLCYGGQLWYEPVQKFRQDADGMELLGEAYVFQLKTTLLDAENGNRRQKVYVYGNRKDLSELLVRFQAEGVDYYYVYQAVSD